MKGIRPISPERQPSSDDGEEDPSHSEPYKKPLNNSKRVLEFQFHSYLQLEGVDKKMLVNSR